MKDTSFDASGAAGSARAILEKGEAFVRFLDWTTKRAFARSIALAVFAVHHGATVRIGASLDGAGNEDCCVNTQETKTRNMRREIRASRREAQVFANGFPLRDGCIFCRSRDGVYLLSMVDLIFLWLGEG